MAVQRAFYADFAGQRRRFHLRAGEVLELERVTGAFIGVLIARFVAWSFSARDLRETVRLGLIGGGEVAPDEAERIVAYWIDAQPLEAAIAVATKTLEALVKGLPEPEPGEGLAAPPSPATAPPSTPSG